MSEKRTVLPFSDLYSKIQMPCRIFAVSNLFMVTKRSLVVIRTILAYLQVFAQQILPISFPYSAYIELVFLLIKVFFSLL